MDRAVRDAEGFVHIEHVPTNQIGRGVGFQRHQEVSWYEVPEDQFDKPR
jgi:hypothetical protein